MASTLIPGLLAWKLAKICFQASTSSGPPRSSGCTTPLPPGAAAAVVAWLAVAVEVVVAAAGGGAGGARPGRRQRAERAGQELPTRQRPSLNGHSALLSPAAPAGPE